MIDSRLWASVPFSNDNALLDFAGSLELWHRCLEEHVARVTGKSYARLPLGTPGGAEWLHAVQSTYRAAAAAIGTAPPPDLESYDLAQPGDHASWFFTIAQTSRSLALAAGFV